MTTMAKKKIQDSVNIYAFFVVSPKDAAPMRRESLIFSIANRFLAGPTVGPAYFNLLNSSIRSIVGMPIVLCASCFDWLRVIVWIVLCRASTQYFSCTSVWFRQCIKSQQFDRAVDKCRRRRSAQSPLLNLCELVPMKSSSRLHFANDAERPQCDSATTMRARCDRDATSMRPRCVGDAAAMRTRS